MSDYEVGRGKPPKHTRFKPGESGNKGGRPRKAPRAEVPSQIGRDMRAVCRRKITMNTPDGPLRLTIGEAVMYRIAMDALAGKISQQKLLVRLLLDGYVQNIMNNDVYGNFDKLISKFGDPHLSSQMLDQWAQGLAHYSRRG